MGLAALSNFVAVAVWLFVSVIDPQFGAADQWRFSAQLQFMHSMATFSCATFMNIGAQSARHVPGLFLGGTAFVCAGIYADPTGDNFGFRILKCAGSLMLLAGWLILARSAQEIGGTAECRSTLNSVRKEDLA